VGKRRSGERLEATGNHDAEATDRASAQHVAA
jgi:hypothetical protein